jgi:hypothetical protein
MREICVEYQWSSAKMLPLSRSSTTFHSRLADIWRMYDEWFALVTPIYHWQKICCANYARFWPNSLVIVRRLCVIFRGKFDAHNPVLALFGTFACLCAGVRGLLVICVWSFRIFCAMHSPMNFHSVNQWKWSNFLLDKHTQPNFMRDPCIPVLVRQCDWGFRLCRKNRK